MSRGRNLPMHRNVIGFSGMLPAIISILCIVVVLGVFVVVQQRMGESRHRIDSMRREMASIETAMLSLRSQQDAMVTRESLRQRLQRSGVALVPIQTQSIIYIEQNNEESAVAMEVPVPIDPRRKR